MGLALTLLLAAAVYFSGLGRFGLHSTEGHRAIPAWSMADTLATSGAAHAETLLIPRLFERPYLRKPPGVQWLIGSTSLAFGESEAAARAALAACATLSAVLSLLFAGRWFGWRWSIVVGPAAILAPFTWATARTAEIEALNFLGTQLATFALIDLFLHHRPDAARPPAPKTATHTRAFTLLAALGIFIAGIAKGPASLPLLPAIIGASMLATRSRTVLRSWGGWGAIALGGAALCIPMSLIAIAVASLDEPVVTQGVSEFLWSWSRLPHVLAMAPIALLSAAPLSFALLFPFGSDARAEAERHDPRSLDIARTLALTTLLSLFLYTLAGVHNPRYAMPATCILAPLVAYVWRGLCPTLACQMSRARRLSAGFLMGGHPAVLGAALLIAFVVYASTTEPFRGSTSGRDAGIALASHLPDGATLIARDLVEARPETIWYAVREAHRSGLTVHARWTPEGIADHPPGTLLLLRTDDQSREAQALLARGWPRVEPVTSIRVHQYDATLYRVVSRDTLVNGE